MTKTRRGVSFEQLLFVLVLASFAYALLLDGFLRLSTGNEALRIVRDLPSAALIAILVARAALHKGRMPRLPMLGLVTAFTLIVTVQIFHPAELGLFKGVQALRPHLEFVVLFLAAAIAFKDDRRLEHLLLLVACCAAVNGAVGLTQSQLTPDQLASWGPGYQKLVDQNTAAATGDVARTFVDNSGVVRVRPPALGTDAGFGATVGMIGLSAALALVLLIKGPRRYLAMAAVPLIVGGIATSQIRSALVAAIFATLVFLLIIGLRPGGGRTMFAVAAVATAVVAVATFGFRGEINTDRYESVTPGNLSSSFGSDRGGSYTFTLGYLADYPLGAGVGSVGPGGSVGASRTIGKNAENGVNFLVLETGIPGLLVMFAMYAAALAYGFRLAAPRVARYQAILVASLVAPIAGQALLFLSGPVMASPPFTLFFYTAAGCIAVRVAARRSHSSAFPLAVTPGGAQLR